MTNNAKSHQDDMNDLDIGDCRDQGFTRPKVLILLPFRSSAFKVVDVMSKLLMSKEEEYLGHKKRFKEEYGSWEKNEKLFHKPASYKAMFSGNVDDCFRLGIQIQPKFLKLYTDFYSSDIIIASPLGLRTVLDSARYVNMDGITFGCTYSVTVY
jgi:U3 small nucleolar RNA-associated protein 25